MSFVVFGGVALFSVYAFAHFLHEWRDMQRAKLRSRRHRDG